MNNYYIKQNIPERLITAEGAIVIAQTDPELTEALKSVGYQEEHFAQANQLVESATSLATEQEVHRGAQVAATAAVTEAYDVVRRYFGDDRRLLRIALRSNRKLYLEMRLHIRAKNTRAASVQQMIHFYKEAIVHPDVVQALAEQHVASDRFAGRIEAVDALINALQVQQHLQGQVFVTTQKRREAMKALDDWMTTFIRDARYVFNENEEQLRKLGVGVRVKS